MERTNTVFILTDQHNPFFAGCYGHPLAETPALDSIAQRGVRFQHAYCNSPLCVPSRASLFTGRYVFENQCWDNAFPWNGQMRGWPDFLKARGVQLVTVGKLDFKPGADFGIGTGLLPGHRNSRDIHGLFRHEAELPPRWSEHAGMLQSGPRAGLTEESFDDRAVALRAAQWIAQERPSGPWALNVNFLQPHPYWPCPPALWEKWWARVQKVTFEPKYFEPFEKLHPYHQAYAHHCCGRYASDELLRRCYAGYLAHIEMVDSNIRIVLDALAAAGILDQTLVICASDHGENCRAHRMWGKMNMYEDAIRVPFVAMGPGVQRGSVEQSAVSLMDVFPTIAEAAGAGVAGEFRGISLLPQLRGESAAPRNRFVLSEYHANGTPGGLFAVTDGHVKYVHAAGARPMLFDLDNDPQELNDLAAQPLSPGMQSLVREREQWLRALCSPEEVDARAKKDQARLRKEMEQDGSLAKEIYKRGYELRSDRLVPRPEFVPEEFRTF